MEASSYQFSPQSLQHKTEQEAMDTGLISAGLCRTWRRTIKKYKLTKMFFITYQINPEALTLNSDSSPSGLKPERKVSDDFVHMEAGSHSLTRGTEVLRPE